MKTIEINIDFDGTCVSHDFPRVGKDIGSIPVLKKLVKAGHRLILFTMRCDHPEEFELKGSSGIQAGTGDYLQQAIDWFNYNGIPLYGVQTNPTQHNWTISPKSYAALMIDDSALGCPLTVDEEISHRPFVDWVEVDKMLKEQGLYGVE